MGFMRLVKVDPGPDGGADVYVRPGAIEVIEPTRCGCRIVTAKGEWHVQHSPDELMRAQTTARGIAR